MNSIEDELTPHSFKCIKQFSNIFFNLSIVICVSFFKRHNRTTPSFFFLHTYIYIYILFLLVNINIDQINT